MRDRSDGLELSSEHTCTALLTDASVRPTTAAGAGQGDESFDLGVGRNPAYVPLSEKMTPNQPPSSAIAIGVRSLTVDSFVLSRRWSSRAGGRRGSRDEDNRRDQDATKAN